MRFTFFIALFGLALVGCNGSGGNANDGHAEKATPPAAMTSLERGAILYKRCRACHTLGQGERNKVGPNLWQVFGRSAGTRDDFNYSSAMDSSDIVWTNETMSAYLERPAEYMPGNRMSFAGLRKAEDRNAVIEYLRVNTGAPNAERD